MKFVEFTQKQKDIIKHRGDLLVKASAGTGKTTVMIQRILELVREKVIDVSNILVVTFTNAAATDMRSRLIRELHERSHVSEYALAQSEAAEAAAISTIHGFCNDCVRKYFYIVNVDPNYTLGINSGTLKKEIIEKVFEKYYRENDAAFIGLLDSFGSRNDSALSDAVLKIHKFMECCPDFSSWRKYAEGLHSGDFYKNMYTEYINRYAVSAINELESLASKNPSLKSHLADCVETVKPLLGSNLNELLKYAGNITFKRWNPKFSKEPNCAEIKAYRDNVRDSLKKFGDFDSDELADPEEVLSAIKKLFDIAENFAAEYNKRKIVDASLDFSDLERLTLEILNNTEALEEIKYKYKMIFVDEYQDVNDIQEAIIEKLGAKGFFAVGDTKQSIYGFRQSRPENFLKRETSFKCGEGRVFDLTDNFRSDRGILDFVNRVMRCAMTVNFGKCDYEREALLTGGHGDEHAEAGIFLTRPENDDEEEAKAEAEIIAGQIDELLGKTVNGKPLSYGDMVILTRSAKDFALKVCERLRSLGVRVETAFDRNENVGVEVQELIHFLRILNNPLDDISLYGLMISGIGGFSAREAAELRGTGNSELYSCLRESSSIKAVALCALIEKYRFYAQSLDVGSLLLRLIEEKKYDLYVLRLSDGGIRVDALNGFLKGLKGNHVSSRLDKFIEYIDNRGSLTEKLDQTNSDTVKIVTMHGAKGLEYEVVFLVETHKRFRHNKDNVLIDKENGATVSLFDKDESARIPSLSALCIKQAIEKKETEEELRLLYVAMTRAKRYLYILGKSQKSRLIDPSDAGCMLDWVLSGAKQNEFLSPIAITPPKKQTSEAIFFSSGQDIENARAALKFKYPFICPREGIPVKLSPSKLDIGFDAEDRVKIRLLNERPSTEVGTAYHRMFEHLPFRANYSSAQTILDSLVIDGYIDKITARKIDIGRVIVAMNNPQLLHWAETCEIRRELPFIMNIPYSELYPLGEDIRDTVLMQGIIDLLFYDKANNSAVIIDYKYTADDHSAVKRYAAQTAVYAAAAKQIFRTRNVKAYVYSVITGSLIPM